MIPRSSTVRKLLLLTAAFAAGVSANLTAQPWDTTQPRGKTRTIEFTAEEGTWMTIDVSPDGRWLVFDLLGHIYRLPIEGGEAQCLTQDSGIAINEQPAFSPDGKRLAFISERGGHYNLWVMDADGANPKPVRAEAHVWVSTPAWTADGAQIVAQRMDTNNASGWFVDATLGLWRYPLDGGPPVRLSSENPKRAESPSLSSDGKSIYYALFVATGNSNARLIDLTRGDYRLIRQDLASGETASVSPLGGIAPQISPDGRWLAFTRRRPDTSVEYSGRKFGPANALWLRDLHAGTERVVMQPVDPDLAHGGTITAEVPQTYPRYSWTPDGNSIVIAQGGKIRRLDVHTGKVAMIPFQARVHRVISEPIGSRMKISDGPLVPQVTRWATRSPRGERVVFQAVGRLWIKDSARAEPRRLTAATSGGEFAPAWSPDGKWIAYTHQDSARRGHLWKVSLEGGAPVQLTSEPGEYWNPDWSADGSSLAAIRSPGIDSEIGPGATEHHLITVSAEGGPQRRIGKLKGILDRLPMLEYAADGRVYFPEHTAQRYAPPRTRPPVTELISIAADGSDRRIHAKVPYAEALTLSADGRWLAIERRADVFVTEVADSKAPLMLEEDDFKRSGTGAVRFAGIGHYPRWRSASHIEFDALSRHVLYAADSGKLTAIDLKLRVPRPAPSGRIVLRGARIVTLDQRQVIERGDIVIEKSRIACVGTCDSERAEKILDVSGSTIVPGFVDMHSPANNEYDFVSALSQGVTTAFDPSASRTELSMAQRELIESGNGIGPRLFGAGSNLRDDANARDNFVRIATFEDAKHEARKYAAFGAIALKNLSVQDAAGRQMIAEAARDQGLRVTGHLIWASLGSTLSHAMEGYTGVQHFPLIVPLYSDVTTFLGKSGFTFNATLAASGPVINREYFIQEREFWKDEKIRRFTSWKILMEDGPYAPRYPIRRPEVEYPFPHHSQGAADIIARGGHVAMATHGWGYAPHWEMRMLSSAMGPMGALESATYHGLHFLGANAEVGSITVGKLADLVVLEANPLEDISSTAKIRYVMKGGTLYDARTMDEIWPQARPFEGVRWDRLLP